MDIYKIAKKIRTQQEFVEFLKLLRKDCEENSFEWENNTLQSFLQGIEGYSLDKKFEEASWCGFAEILIAARVYE